MRPKVIYIDEEPKALRLNSRALQRCVGDEAEVIGVEPVMGIGEMLEKIFSFQNLSAVIIDQKLKAAGTADYFGTELAAAIRGINQKLPVYILTNYAQDLDGYDGNIEYVLSKDDLAIEDKKNAIAKRLRRHLNVFNDLVTEREERFEQLLRKSHSKPLSEDEKLEYQELSFYREKQFLAAELLDSAALNRQLETVEEKLTQIMRKLGIQ